MFTWVPTHKAIAEKLLAYENRQMELIQILKDAGETTHVLKEKDIRKYGEYRTRRLVLEANGRLRPGWDMEAHLLRLKETWEACQVDLSGDAGKKQSQDDTGGIVREPEMGYGGLFDGVE